MSTLNNKPLLGVDNINNILVKRTSVVTIPFIVLLINRSFSRSFPGLLSRAKVIPLHKEGSKVDGNNHRPISLLTVCCKIFERVMYNHNFFESQQLFYEKFTKSLVLDGNIVLLMPELNLLKAQDWIASKAMQ